MDAGMLVELVPSVGLAIALASCAGLRTWLPLLLTGLVARAGYLELSSSFQFLASDRALLLFAVATVVEVVADKIPAVDHALDALSTVLRPVAGTVLASSVLLPLSDPLTAVVLGALVGAPSALVPHAAKSVLRTASSVLTFGLANPVLSLLEDVAVVAAFVLAVLVPAFVVAGLLLTAMLVVRRWSRTAGAPAAPTPAA